MAAAVPAIAEIDHLVVAARTLDEGVQWCEATLGVTPAAGGAHPLMGTHNRLLNVAAPGFARTYLEIIAIDPSKQPTRAAGLHRWYDLDDGALQGGLAQNGPRLVHWVAGVSDARTAAHALGQAETHIDRGPVLEAARDTPAGRLEWLITVRDDGQRLFYGTLPTLIQWGAVHPIDSLPPSGVTLTALRAEHPRAATLQQALATLGLPRFDIAQGPPNLVATVHTPRGMVTLESKGL